MDPLSPFPSPEAGRASLPVHQFLLIWGQSGVPRVPAGAVGVYVAKWLSPPVIHIGLRWLRGSGDGPAGRGQ